MNAILCFSLLLLAIAQAYPHGYSAPRRTVMFGGYYGQPSRSYLPPGVMSFAAGDAIATNSFVPDADPEQDKAESNQEISEEEDNEDVSIAATPPAKKTPKRRKPQAPEVDGEESDEEGGLAASWPFQGGRNGAPAYNAFFPIMFGGSGGARGRNGDEGGYYPGPATAIANSFSTGKGGVATSHATSFGDPYLSSLLRNAAAGGGFNVNKKANSRQ